MAEIEKKENKVYSYHTFILPFTWKMFRVNSNKEYSELKKVFEDNPFWKNTNLKSDNDILSKPDLDSPERIRSFYKEYQYLYPYVRKSVYGYEDDICANYVLEKAINNGTYHIYKDKQHYVLHINAIRVRIVNTGVALFIMECENHGTDGNGNPQTSIEAVKNINDFGRRITLPYINQYSNICADKLEIEIPEIDTYVDDFKSFIEKACMPDTDCGQISLNHTCDFIKKLMSYGSEYSFSSHNTVSKKEIQVKPALDDRMYVAFAAYDREGFVNSLLPSENEDDYRYTTDDKLSKSLYELAFCDNSGNCSCPDLSMRKKLIEDALYKRWLPYESLYTISEMGFGMVSTAKIGGELDHLYESFICCYLQMVYISLIQRASIVKFYRETSDIAKHFAANGRKLRRKDIRNIMNLQERKSAFDSQLVFSEVSSEQQGIELYDMIKSAFSLETENEKLSNNLNSLYEITNTDLNISVNAGVGILTWVSVFLAVGALLYNILFTSDVVIREEGYSALKGTLSPWIWDIDAGIWIFLLFILIPSVIAIICIRVHNRRK